MATFLSRRTAPLPETSLAKSRHCSSGGILAISNGSGNIIVGGSGTYSVIRRPRYICPPERHGPRRHPCNGIRAYALGNRVFGNASAIRAEIANPANSSNIVVDRSGDITAVDTFPTGTLAVSAAIHALTAGTGNITVASGAGATISNVGVFGIEASAYGTGSTGSINVSTGALSTLTANGTGIFADNSATAIPASAGSTIKVTANGTINSGAHLKPGRPCSRGGRRGRRHAGRHHRRL